MSEKRNNLGKKIKKNILINGIFFFGVILCFLFGYIFYKFFLTGKISNNISKNIDYFVEFDLENFDRFSEFLGKNQPFYTPYLDEMEFKKGAIIFYKGEKIDAILTGSEKKSINFLERISTKPEISEKNQDLNKNLDKKNISLNQPKLVKKENKFIISNDSPAPNCIQNGKNLFCLKNREILENFISDIEKGEILKKDRDFLKTENNLNNSSNFIFGYANLKNEKKYPLISEKFISGGFSFWKKNILSKNSEIEGIFYGNYKKESGEIFYKKKKNINLEKYFDKENTIFLAYSRDFFERLEKYFEFYSEKNPEMTKLGKNIFEEKKSEIKLFLEQNSKGKIFFENPEKNVFVLSENSDFLLKNKEKIFDENIFSDEKIFINLEKIREKFGENFGDFFGKKTLEYFNFFSAYSKNFDDGIQVKIEIK